MRIFSFIRNLAGLTGGVVVYFILKKAADLVNYRSVETKLTSQTLDRLRPFFPGLEMENVRIKEGSSIPPNWFRKKPKFSAITFGYTIYTTGTKMQSTNENLNIIIHELVHTHQVRLRDNNEVRFAADYGKGFLAAGNYRNNPLEKEAFDFAENHSMPLSQGFNS